MEREWERELGVWMDDGHHHHHHRFHHFKHHYDHSSESSQPFAQVADIRSGRLGAHPAFRGSLHHPGAHRQGFHWDRQVAFH